MKNELITKMFEEAKIKANYKLIFRHDILADIKIEHLVEIIDLVNKTGNTSLLKEFCFMNSCVDFNNTLKRGIKEDESIQSNSISKTIKKFLEKDPSILEYFDFFTEEELEEFKFAINRVIESDEIIKEFHSKKLQIPDQPKDFLALNYPTIKPGSKIVIKGRVINSQGIRINAENLWKYFYVSELTNSFLEWRPSK